jgi:outer membrane lipoprotein LolB
MKPGTSSRTLLRAGLGRLHGKRLLAALGLALLLGACATPTRTAPPGENAWNGRLAVQVDSDPPQSFSAGFELLGQPLTGELQLNSPLGTTLATVVWSPTGAQLRQGGQVTRRASLDELTTELAGTALPVAALFDWLQGQPTPSNGWQADLSRHEQGRITARRLSPLPSAELRIVFQP